jgi:hypothetical protein
MRVCASLTCDSLVPSAFLRRREIRLRLAPRRHIELQPHVAHVLPRLVMQWLYVELHPDRPSRMRVI